MEISHIPPGFVEFKYAGSGESWVVSADCVAALGPQVDGFCKVQLKHQHASDAVFVAHGLKEVGRMLTQAISPQVEGK